MKKILLMVVVAIMAAVVLPATVQAKKVTVTIDGTVWPSQTKLYLIINGDTANAQQLPIEDAKFSVTVTVDRNAIICLHDSKEWLERSTFVLIPDSRHITIDWSSGTILGSKESSKLKSICQEIKRESPEGFHIDVFSDDPEQWRKAQEMGESIRQSMLVEQKKVAQQALLENKNNIYGVWIVYCFPELFEGEFNDAVGQLKGKWAKHPILKLRKKQ